MEIFHAIEYFDNLNRIYFLRCNVVPIVAAPESPLYATSKNSDLSKTIETLLLGSDAPAGELQLCLEGLGRNSITLSNILGFSLKPETLRPAPPLFLNEDELFWLNPSEDLHQFAFDKVSTFFGVRLQNKLIH